MEPTSDPSLWAKVAEKALDKLPVEKLYEDLAQPGFKKVGEALATLLGTANTILFPIAWLNGRTSIYLHDNLRRYQAKLDSVDENVIPVPEILSIPILEQLSLTTHAELSEAFLNLLTKASFDSSVRFVHPAFSSILMNMSADEAKILFALKDKDYLPSINGELRYFEDGQNYSTYEYNRTDLQDWVNLDFADNTSLYIENFIRLKILEPNYEHPLSDSDEVYRKIESNLLENAKLKRKNSRDPKFTRGLIHFTIFGKRFLDACVKDINETRE